MHQISGLYYTMHSSPEIWSLTTVLLNRRDIIKHIEIKKAQFSMNKFSILDFATENEFMQSLSNGHMTFKKYIVNDIMYCS